MALVEINNRYSLLANESCCLSCGGAIDYSKPQPGEICVDLGSGRGTDALRMAEEVGEKGLVYGIDISDGMLEKAASTANKMNVTNVKFLKAELENLPLENESVNLLISNCTINHALDKQKVWNEIFRILKNEGRFIVSDIYSISPVPEKFKTDAQAIAECWGGAVTKPDYLKQLERAGFLNIEILDESKPYSKGEIEVCSFTIRAFKTKCCCN